MNINGIHKLTALGALGCDDVDECCAQKFSQVQNIIIYMQQS